MEMTRAKAAAHDSSRAKGCEIGALVVGGDHSGLGIARSLGRRGIPVYVLDDQHCISSFSRYVDRVVRVKDLRDERAAVAAILDTGQRFGLKDWVLFPTRDETVAATSRYRSELAKFFRVATPEWSTVKWAWDKKYTYELATKLGIPCPRTFIPKHADDLADLYSSLPLAVKPSVKENFFYATGDKAWRADTPAQLDSLYAKALQHVPGENVLIQEIIPGGGSQQYSFCAFFRDGKVHSSLVAKRQRQHPREFGRAATYVETIEEPAIEELSTTFLKAIDYYGLVELEFKLDPRDQKYKLLDVNARTWGFHRLGQATGVDFPYLLFSDQLGELGDGCRAKPGVGWLRLLADLPTALADICQGQLRMSAYFGSLQRTGVESVFSREDPLPFLAELLLLPYLIVKKKLI